MSNRTWNLLLAAAEEGAKNNGDQGMPFWVMIVPAILIFLVFQMMFGGQHRKEQKRKAELVGSLKKNDRVVTIGGITGSVASISEDKQFVTIKVEDNTRIKMLASSIQNVVTDEKSEEAGAGVAAKS